METFWERLYFYVKRYPSFQIQQSALNNWQEQGQRPHTISSSFERGGLHQRPLLNGQTFLAPPDKQLPNSEPVSPSKINGLHGLHSDLQTYSTIKRSYRYYGKKSPKSFFLGTFRILFSFEMLNNCKDFCIRSSSNWYIALANVWTWL